MKRNVGSGEWNGKLERGDRAEATQDACGPLSHRHVLSYASLCLLLHNVDVELMMLFGFFWWVYVDDAYIQLHH